MISQCRGFGLVRGLRRPVDGPHASTHSDGWHSTVFRTELVEQTDPRRATQRRFAIVQYPRLTHVRFAECAADIEVAVGADLPEPDIKVGCNADLVLGFRAHRIAEAAGGRPLVRANHG